MPRWYVCICEQYWKRAMGKGSCQCLRPAVKFVIAQSRGVDAHAGGGIDLNALMAAVSEAAGKQPQAAALGDQMQRGDLSSFGGPSAEEQMAEIA